MAKQFWRIPISQTVTLIAMAGLSQTTAANVQFSAESPQLISTVCPAALAQDSELAQLRHKIYESGNLKEARHLALAPTDAAMGAIRHARAIMPFSNDLRLAENRLADARSRIEKADSPHQIADEFSGMMLAGLDSDRAAHLSVGKIGCDYSTGEIIAIVVGLILGIIPGLILLIVLC